MKKGTGLSLLIRGGGITRSPLGLRLGESVLAAFGALPGSSGAFIELDLGRRGADKFGAVKGRGGRVCRHIGLKPRRYSVMPREELRGFFSGVARAALAVPVSALPAGGQAGPARRAAPKVLIFRSLLNSDRKASSSMHQASWYLASALKAAGARPVFSEIKLSVSGEDFEDGAQLSRLLRENRDIAFAALTLSEFYFQGAEKLAAFIKKELPGCRVAVGGIMPSLHPFHVLANMPSADLLVRGDGEKIFPRAVSILGRGAPDRAAERELLELEGFIYRDASRLIFSGAGLSNAGPDLDYGVLDFSLLDRRDVMQGGAFYLSRGCLSSCNFCVSLNKGRFRAVSAEKAGEWLKAYKERVRELFGAAAPARCLGLGFYDDDFFADRERALDILGRIKRCGLFAAFLQTGIRSFFRSGRLDSSFLRRLDSSFFRPSGGAAEEKTDIFIGTENFCDRELRTLGKGYGRKEIEAVTGALSAKGIRQSHHLIMSNVFTRVADLRENAAVIEALKKSYAPYFDILRPVTPGLYSFYGTASCRRVEEAGLAAYANMKTTLSVPGFKEYDYPVAGGDTPADRAAAKLLRTALSRLAAT